MQKYWKTLLKLIQEGKLNPAMVITHRMPLDEAARGYKIFNDKHEEDGTLVQKVRSHKTYAEGMSLVMFCSTLLLAAHTLPFNHNCIS